MRIRVWGWLAALLVGITAVGALGSAASAQGLAVDDLLRAPSGPDPTTLAEMLARLDQLAADFEDAKDVKCWTSLGQLETFVAGADFSPEATHAKTEVVLGYLDQLWRSAAEGGAPVSVARLEAAGERHFPLRADGLASVQILLGERVLEIPGQDLRDYEGTVEPLRLLRTLTERAARSDPDRAPLSSAAIDRAVSLASVVATVVLKESNALARKNRHERIQASDVLGADRAIAAAVGLAAHDPAKRPAVVAPSTADVDLHEVMRGVIRGKIRSLDVFNTRYSSEELGEHFDENLAKQEAQWAHRPVAEEASRFYKEKALVELAGLVYRRAAAEHPSRDLLTGPEMLETLTGLYPLVTEYFGVTLLFPSADGGKSFWVAEHIADAFRDTAWHWKALERAVEQAREAGASLPAMDLYAMEELTEFVSIYAVALVQTAGAQAMKRGEKEVTVASVKAALAFFEENRKVELAARAKSVPRSGSDWEADAALARKELEKTFVAEAFSDVTGGSGLDFVFQDSKLVRSRRFPAAGALQADGSLRITGLPKQPELFSPDTPEFEVGIAGGGVAVADVDGDGLLDVYFANGEEDRLYRNLGGLRFADVTRAAGLVNPDAGRAAYFIDYDNDGDPDLFVTQIYAPNRLFRNRGDGTFEDVTERAGLPLASGLVSHSATWFDFNNDGHLDVYVGNFGDWLGGTFPQIHHARNGQANQLFVSRGDGTFEDRTEATRAGSTGWTHAISHFDANGDGWQDLYLANDFGRDELLLNLKGERFFDATPDELRERSLHGMSVSFTDSNGDGIEDVYVSNIAIFSFVSKYIKPGEDTELRLTRRTVANARMVENNAFLVSEDGRFVERQHDYFDRSEDGDGWAWDADFFDFDNDGAEDLYVANGREPNLTYDRERNVLYRQSKGRFFDVSRGSGADVARNSRGVAAADLDGDGDLDLVLNNYLDGATLLRNNLRRNHWVQIQLRGTASNRDAIGARVIVETAGRKQARTVRGGSGFLSQDPMIQSFGLGEEARIERVEIRWPSGAVQVVEDLASGRLHRIEEVAPAGRPAGVARSD